MSRAAVPYRAILFDVMDTLVREPFFCLPPEILGAPIEELLPALAPGAWVEFELGRIDEATLERRFFADGRSYPHEAMKQALFAGYAWLEGVEPLLGELCAAGHELHLMTNYPVWWRRIEDKLGLSRYARWSFVSCELGMRKPDPAIYRHAVAALRAEAHELLLVDDRAANCRGAAELGIDTIRFTGAAVLLDELARRGLLTRVAG